MNKQAQQYVISNTKLVQFMAHNFDCAITLLNYIDNKDHLISYGKD